MKKYLFLATVALLAFTVQAQEQRPARQELKPLKSEATKAEPMKTGKDPLEGETIAHLDYVIAAIDHKVAYVKNDEEAHKKALESGWYEQMAASRAKLVAKKELLIQRNNSN